MMYTHLLPATRLWQKMASNGAFSSGIALLLITLSGFPGRAQPVNQPPRVQIELPAPGATFGWDSALRYRIRVADAEDGDSQYGEINPTEVGLEIFYLSDTTQAATLLQQDQQTQPDPPGLLLIRRSDCFGCHSLRESLTGPAFVQIARRYQANREQIQQLAGRVVQGHTGGWGSAAMPPHPQFTQAQAAQIVEWILTRSTRPDWWFLPGIEGAIRTISKPAGPARGVYVLRASYTDHDPGPRQADQRRQHTVVLHPRPTP